FSGTVTCPAFGSCGRGFTLRDAGTTTSYPIFVSSGPSGSTVTLILNPPAPAAGQALVLDYANGFMGDAAGNPIAAFSNQPVANLTIPLDNIPPTTVATLSPSSNINGWNNTDVIVILKATDNPGGSGVKQLEFALSGAQNAGRQIVTGDTASVTISAE